jgi:hypothetical protein
MTPLQYRHVTIFQRRGRRPQGERALTGAERQARYRQRHADSRPPPPRRPQSIRVASRRQRWQAAVAELVSLQASMRHGSRRCPRIFATAPPARYCRRSSISISTRSVPSNRRVALGGIEMPRRACTVARPRGPTGTPRASLRQTRVGRCAMARVPPMDFGDDPLRRDRHKEKLLARYHDQFAELDAHNLT